jgi:hypothetical protein
MTSRALPLVVIAICGSAAVGCDGNSIPVELSGQTTVAGDPLSAGAALTRIPAIGSFSSIDLDKHPELKLQGVTRDGVQSLKVDHLQVKIVSPPDQGFDFLDEVRFFASSGNQETEVAGKSNISKLGLAPPHPVLVLEPTQVELRPFLAAPTLGLVVRGSGRVPPQDVRLEALVRMRVELKIF